MKQLVPVIVTLQLIFTIHPHSLAQQRLPDTLAIGAWDPRYAGLLHVPILLHNTPVGFAPTQKICFDKKIFIKGSNSRNITDTYVYLNTSDGIVGIITGRDGTLGDGSSFNITDDKFNMMVIGKKGNTYTYFNSKKDGEIMHYVNTAASETNFYRFDPPANTVIKRSGKSNFYCSGKFKALSYKATPGSPELYLYGPKYPEKVLTKNFIGYSGIGYIATDLGIYMCLEITSSSQNYFEAREWNDVDICFDPADFKEAEMETINRATNSLSRQKEKLDSKTYSGNCAGVQQQLDQQKKRNIEKQKELLKKTQSGNALQSPAAQQAYADLQDPVDELKTGLLQKDVEICKLEQRLQNARTQTDRQSLTETIQCKRTEKSELQNVIMQMEAINASHEQSPAKKLMEKRKLLGQLSSKKACP